MISYSKLVRSVRLNIFLLKAKHSLNNLPSTGAAAAAVSETIKDNIRLVTRSSLAEFKLTGKVKVWQTSYIQKYRDNYCEGNHEMSSDRNVQSEMAVEEKHPRNLACLLKY